MINLSLFYKIVSDVEINNEKTELKSLFFDITKNWTSEKDIDYSISLVQIGKMVDLIPLIINEHEGAIEYKQKVCAELMVAKCKASDRRRIL